MKVKEELEGALWERTSKYFSPKSSKIFFKNQSSKKLKRVSAKISQKIISEKKFIFTETDKSFPNDAHIF